MKNAITTRRVRHAGTDYAKGAPITLPADQFDAWEGAGIVRAAPKSVPAPAAPRAKPVKARAKPAK